MKNFLFFNGGGMTDGPTGDGINLNHLEAWNDDESPGFITLRFASGYTRKLGATGVQGLGFIAHMKSIGVDLRGISKP